MVCTGHYTSLLLVLFYPQPSCTHPAPHTASGPASVVFQEKFLPPLLIFGDQPDHRDLEDGDVQLCFGRMLPVLLDMWNFCKRVYTVVQSLMQQLASLYSPKHKKKSPLTAYQAVHFQPVWGALAEALGVLIAFDEVCGACT